MKFLNAGVWQTYTLDLGLFYFLSLLLYILFTVHGFLILYVNLCKSYYDQVKVEKF